MPMRFILNLHRLLIRHIFVLDARKYTYISPETYAAAVEAKWSFRKLFQWKKSAREITTC